jgi:gamma-glutamyl-gamma-aminobutyrate hydrolase PuuD
MPSPLIGLTSYRHLNTYGLPLNSITEAYVRAVSNAGAIPVMIPLGLAEETLDALLERLDGIVLQAAATCTQSATAARHTRW